MTPEDFDRLQTLLATRAGFRLTRDRMHLAEHRLGPVARREGYHNVEAMLESGRAHIARGQAFYGIAALEGAREARPGDWRAWSLLGTAYEQVRRPDDARAAWAQALVLSPDNPDVLSNLAISAMTRGDAAGAEPLLRRAVAQPGASLKVRCFFFFLIIV